MNSLKQQLCLEITLQACEQAAKLPHTKTTPKKPFVSEKNSQARDASFQFLRDAVTVSLQNETEKLCIDFSG